MSNKLKIETQILEDKAAITLSGVIDEDSDFEKISNLGQKEYIFDFEGITSINSCGIRDWIKFLEDLPIDSKIIYQKCPQIIIEQLGMVHGFLPENGTIESFFAPYYCDSCDKEEKILLKVDEVVNKKAPEKNCPECNDGPMEFDAIEVQYFNFLK